VVALAYKVGICCTLKNLQVMFKVTFLTGPWPWTMCLYDNAVKECGEMKFCCVKVLDVTTLCVCVCVCVCVLCARSLSKCKRWL